MNKKIQSPLDQNVREKAVGKGSFIVQAPAGSGKTSLLIKRFLNCLLEVRSPKEVIALTFTNKAASEMEQRLKQALKGEVKNQEIKDLVKKISKQALINKWSENYIDSLMVMTIDKLALKLIQQTPILSKSGVNFLTDEDPDEIYREAIKESITSYADNDTLFKYFNYDYHKLTEQLLILIKKRDQWLPIISSFVTKNDVDIQEQYTRYYTNEIKHWVKQKIEPIFSEEEIIELEIIVNYSADNKEISKTNNLRYSKNPEFWFYFRDLIISKDGKTILKRFTHTSGFPSTDDGKKIKNKLLNILSKKNNKINILVEFYNVVYTDKIQDIFPIIITFSTLLVDMIARLNEKFNTQRVVDFTQIMGNAVEALRDTHLPLILDQNISHILIDEFQDTNESQLNFLELLTENFSGNTHKSFFAVGDPMQSIYRFRKAEVEIFSRVQKIGIGDLKLQSLFLKVNFRSNKSIINWLNNNYSKVFPSLNIADEGSIPYSSSESNDNNIDQGIFLNPLISSAETKKELYEAEALYVLALIKDIKRKGDDADIAVLTRSRTHLNELITLINKKDSSLPIDAIEISKIQSNQTFQDVYSLTKALYSLNDRVNWISILKCPWCGLTVNDLALLFEEDHKSTVWEIINNKTKTNRLNKDSQKRLYFFISIIQTNIQYRGRVAHRYFIESIWRQLHGEESMIDTNDIKNIDLFLDLLDQSSNTLSIDFLKLERLIKNLYKSETSTEKNPIKFLTIQKSKGLEFDCVIIPNLNKGSRTEIQDLILYDKSTLSIKHPTNNKNLHTYHSYKEKKRLDNEKIRLLYVAITRAKNKCYLIGTIKKDGDKLIPKSGTFMEILWPFMNDKFTEIDVPESIHSYEDFIPKLRRLNSDFFTKINPVTNKKDIELITFSYSSNNQDIQRFTGNIVHKYLEIIVKKQLDIDIILSNKLGYIESLFIAQNYNKDDIDIALNVVKQSIKMLKESIDGQWIFQHHLNDKSEVHYLLEQEHTFDHLIPDRSFIDNNVQWIVDYKTPFLPIKDLSGEAKKHRSQLNLYENIFKDDDLMIQKAIYFAPQGRLIKL